jgi:NAD(P)-dependent dehydrogenase (short-subunit alcohol dehydrogenase family)
MFDLIGKTALVTGAAGGLGRSFARVLAKQGAKVICADIKSEGAGETVSLIREGNGDAVAVAVDVTAEDSVDDMARGAARIANKIDILINNAGVASVPRRLPDVSIAEWDRVNAINLRGPFLCTRAMLPLLLAARSASIINLASYLGLKGAYPGFPVTAIPYGTTKAGIIGFTRQLAMEYAQDGLRANAIAPGWHMGTDLGAARRAAASPDDNQRFEAFARGTIPMGRFGSPEDLSGLVVYLASDASKYVTGQVFAHDGGITAG